jgi:GTP-binding protein
VELPLIAIVGAPNVGKSTLFNRLVGRRRAIVTDEPGVTRDRLYGEVRRDGLRFRLVDTGGLTPRTAAPFAQEIAEQAEAALEEALGMLFVVDARAGATAVDLELAQMLRRRSIPVMLVANKADGERIDIAAQELCELGLGDPVPVSAEHGRGIDTLLARVAEWIDRDTAPSPSPESGDAPLRVAIVGRPNVGKSSLLNRLVGEERAVVSDVPGTTRDAVDTLLEIAERRYCLIDTAGIRRRGKPRHVAERFSVIRARQNIERCDVVVLVLDASQELAAQDAHIAGYVLDAYKPMVVAVNKWDLIEEREAAAKEWLERVRHRLKFAKQVPLLLLSAKTGQRVTRLLDIVDEVRAAAGLRVSTVDLNRWLEEARGRDGSTAAQGQGFRLFYATQTGVHPPSFLMFCNDPRRAHFSVRRHLENSLRDHFGFGPAPIRLEFRRRRPPRDSRA